MLNVFPDVISEGGEVNLAVAGLALPEVRLQVLPQLKGRTLKKFKLRTCPQLGEGAL